MWGAQFFFPHALGAAASPREEELRAAYDCLGLPAGAPLAEVKARFRELSRQTHPDKPGGSAERFRAVREAYETATAAHRGEPGRRGPARRRTPDATIELDVALRDLYTGATRKISVTRKAVCLDCAGTGATPGAPTPPCRACGGTGQKQLLAAFLPGLAGAQRDCQRCRGVGTVAAAHDRCAACAGDCVVADKRIVELTVEPGTPENHVITLFEAADEKPGCATGDIHIVVRSVADRTFRRNGDDLAARKQLSLREALCAGEFELTHLDGRALRVKAPADSPGVLTPDTVVKVAGEGMPRSDGDGKGDLFVSFEIAFPETLSLRSKQFLAVALPVPASTEPRRAERLPRPTEHTWSAASQEELRQCPIQ